MDLFDLNEVESAKTPPVYTDGTEKIVSASQWHEKNMVNKQLVRVPVKPEDGHMYFKSVDVDDALKTIKAVIGDRKVNLNVSWDSGMR